MAAVQTRRFRGGALDANIAHKDQPQVLLLLAGVHTSSVQKAWLVARPMVGISARAAGPIPPPSPISGPPAVPLIIHLVLLRCVAADAAVGAGGTNILRVEARVCVHGFLVDEPTLRGWIQRAAAANSQKIEAGQLGVVSVVDIFVADR